MNEVVSGRWCCGSAAAVRFVGRDVAEHLVVVALLTRYG